MVAIEINNLVKTYSNGVKALKGINLEIQEGEFFAILGENGAGKTTTIGILTDLVNKTSGTVKIMGIDIDKDISSAKNYIGVVPQEFNFGIFEKVIDIVTTQAGYYGIKRKDCYSRAEEILKKLGLGDKLNMQARTLSGGMKRRLMIARALIHTPKILILDEPTAGVDVNLRLGMWEYLKEINASGTTIILTTHYLEEVEELCNRAAIINKGEIIKLDTVKNLINSLDSEEYLIDTASNVEKVTINNSFNLRVIDTNSLEATVRKDQNLNNLVAQLTSNNIIINSIRPKGNRLETLFIKLVK